MRIKRFLPRISQPARAIALAVLIIVALAISASPRANALAGADFRPGRIIDNAIFYNSDAMSVQAIQEFLNSKVPVCDTSGSKPSGSGGTRAQYGQSRGYPAPYTCLKDFQQNPQNGDSNYGGNPVPPGAKTAAQIIHDAGRTYGINPQVILVTLQAESGIITDDWPWVSQYRTAMGYGCPDSAPCDAQYYGFSNQVNNAAQQLRRYATNPNSFNFVGGSMANVRFSPNASCGSGQVFIENQASAALYNYTPYQPNTAALNNLYGTGDGCSSYRNRNFWRLFNTWFGSTWTNERGTDLGEAQNRIYPVEFNGELYVFYYDAFRRALRMAHAHPTNGWQFSIIDGESTPGNGSVDASVGSSIAITQFNNTLQLFYYDKSKGNLRHGTFNGSTWQFQNLDGDPGSIGGRNTDLGTNPSATVYSGTLQLVYYDRTSANLRHAWHDGANWRFENLDGDRASVSGVDGQLGAFSTLAVYNGTLQLFYYDQLNARLKHAWISSTTGWRFEDFDGPRSVSGQNGLVGISPIAVPIGDALQLFYYDEGRTNLRHAWTTSQHGWRFEDLDGDGNTAVSRRLADVGQTISATKIGDNLHLFYYDRTNGNLRHAWTAPNGWEFANLDGDPGSFGGQNADMGIHGGVTTFWGSSLQLYYYNRSNGSFRHAWTNQNGWNFEDLGPSVIY